MKHTARFFIFFLALATASCKRKPAEIFNAVLNKEVMPSAKVLHSEDQFFGDCCIWLHFTVKKEELKNVLKDYKQLEDFIWQKNNAPEWWHPEKMRKDLFMLSKRYYPDTGNFLCECCNDRSILPEFPEIGIFKLPFPMDHTLQAHFNNLQGSDKEPRSVSYQAILALTKEKVSWTYEIWDDLLRLTKTGDNHQRTIAVQVLSNLAKSDPEQRMLKDFETLLLVTKDEKFVTARHSLQCLWKIALINPALQDKVTQGLEQRFRECISEKNCTLIRYDITEVFRKIFDHTADEKLQRQSLALIETEQDEKYRKKYSGVWKDLLNLRK